MWTRVFVALVGLVLLHIFGVLQYSILTGMGFMNAALLVSVPFLLKDCLSVLLALLVSSTVKTI